MAVRELQFKSIQFVTLVEENEAWLSQAWPRVWGEGDRHAVPAGREWHDHFGSRLTASTETELCVHPMAQTVNLILNVCTGTHFETLFVLEKQRPHK